MKGKSLIMSPDYLLKSYFDRVIQKKTLDTADFFDENRLACHVLTTKDFQSAFFPLERIGI